MTPLFIFGGRSAADGNSAAPWSMEADRIISESTPRTIIAEGGVIIHRPEDKETAPLEIRADSVTYRDESAKIDATGNVSLTEAGSTIRADSVLLGLRERTARMTAASIALADKELNFSGRLVEKTGESRYIFHDGRATSCRFDGDRSPAWSINWKEADITIDGLAFLKHATFKVKKLPLLYIPYLVLPAKVTRQSGFLFPELSHSSRSGLGAVTPFFVNLSPSSDLTLYPGYYEKRGVFGALEFRQVAGYDSRSTLAVNYLHDRTSDQGPPGSDNDYRRDGYLRTTHDRYWVRGKVDQHFSGSKFLRLDIDAVSDQDFLYENRAGMTGFSRNNEDFLEDFHRGLQEASLNFRESVIQFTGQRPMAAAGLEMRYVDDAMADLSDTEPAHTLPRIIFSSRRPLGDLPVGFGWDSEYLQYRPEEGIGYHRLDVFPHLTMPLPLSRLVEGTVAGGLRETLYRVETFGSPLTDWESEAAQNRNAWNFTANIATLLARDYIFSDRFRLTHTFRPNLLYHYLDSGDQNDLPDLDGFDRLADDHSLTLELNNYFRSGGGRQPGIPPRQLGFLKFSQSYDLEEDKRALVGPTDKRRPFSDLAMDLQFQPGGGLSLRYRSTLSVYGNGVTGNNLQLNYANARNDYLAADYYYLAGGERNLKISSQLRLTGKLATRYNITRSLLADHTTSESISLLYQHQCWGLELTGSEDAEDRRLLLTFSLTGIGNALKMSRSEL